MSLISYFSKNYLSWKESKACSAYMTLTPAPFLTKQNVQYLKTNSDDKKNKRDRKLNKVGKVLHLDTAGVYKFKAKYLCVFTFVVVKL